MKLPKSPAERRAGDAARAARYRAKLKLEAQVSESLGIPEREPHERFTLDAMADFAVENLTSRFIVSEPVARAIVEAWLGGARGTKVPLPTTYLLDTQEAIDAFRLEWMKTL